VKTLFFDFDGTLVDSYSCLPEVYRSIGSLFGLGTEFVRRALKYEEIYDLKGGVFDRLKWWPRLFEEFGVELGKAELRKLLTRYWRLRANLSRPVKGCSDVLEYLRSRHKLYILSGSDGLRGMKEWRIRKSGLSRFFLKTFIVGENVKSRREAIEYLKTYGDVIVVDDRPSVIREVKGFARTVLFEFRWKDSCNPDFRIRSLYELKNLDAILST